MSNTDIESIIRGVGLKVTVPRVQVYQQLHTAEAHHMSAEAIFKALSEAGQDVGLATVYRVLSQFEQAGLVTKHHFDNDHAIYELAHHEHHDHLVCRQCGLVKEFCDPLIETQISAIAQEHGFQCDDHQFTLYGLCRGCRGEV